MVGFESQSLFAKSINAPAAGAGPESQTPLRICDRFPNRLPQPMVEDKDA